MISALSLPSHFVQENVAGTAQISRGLAQRAAREHEFVSERRRAVHQHDVELAAQFQILKSVVEDERVTIVVAHRPAPGFHPVFVHHHRDAWQIPRQHEWFVPGVRGVAEHFGAGAHDGGRRLVRLAFEFVPDALFDAGLHAFVTAAENADAPALLLETPRQHFDHGCLAGAADRQVSDADDGGTEMIVGFDPVAEQHQPPLHQRVKEP